MKRVDIMNINSWCRTKFGDIDSNPLSYANHLFLDGMEINDLIIPDDVTTINKFAFFGMNGLNSVTIGNAVTAICDSAFMNSDMKRLNIGNSVTNIGEDTFTVSTLEIVNISDIKAWCNIKFGKEDSYRPLWSNPLVRADHLYLNGVEVKDLIIPNDVDIIGDYAFSYCKSLTSVTISNSVISIGRLAFAFCDEITTATICDSLSTIGYDYTYIDDFAFYGCEKLAKVFFGESVAAIGDCAFQGCTSLDTIFFNAINCENFKTDIGEWMEPCTGTWGHDAHPFYNLNISNIYLGDNVQRIPANFAYDFKRLTCITIPNSVYYIGPDAFSRCSGLTQVSIMDIESWCYIWFGNAAANPLLYAHHLFLNGEEIKDLVIPDSITVINKYAFYGCRGLTSVSIPNSVTEIGIGAFEECTGLKRVNITDLNSWCSIKFGHLDDFVSYGSNPLESAHHLFLKGEEIKDLVIPNNITTINLNTFYKCSGLTSITIPNSVTSIGHFAFCECSGLTSIIIPNSVSSIGDWAFYGCNNLATVFLTGDGEWVTASLLNNYTFLSVASFQIDNRITNVKGVRVKTMDVFSFAVTPPVCDENSFYDYSGTLHVPAASIAAYFTAPYWCNFANIVGDAVKPNGLNLDKDSLDLVIQEMSTLVANTTPATAASSIAINWASSNPAVATVVNGQVTAVGYGECDIVAMCLDQRAVCHVTVYNDRISVDQEQLQVQPNHIVALMPTSLAPELPALVVTSSDPAVAAARVMNGKVQVVGVSEGTATITVSAADGTAKPATCLVTVYTEQGDTNGDGYIDIDDVTALIERVLGNEATAIKEKNADLNDDGIMDIDDVTALIKTILGNN